MPRKHTFETVKKAFEEKGYTLLETEYKNNSEKMKFICPNHPNEENYIRFSDLKRGVKCRHCFNEKRKVINKKYSLEDVKREFEAVGYNLLSTEYRSSSAKLNYVCPIHPDKINSMSYSTFKRGVRCPNCKYDNFIERIQKEGNPSWRGGVTTLNERLRRELKEWKRETLIKHNFKCFITGINSKKLVVHHSLPFHKIRDLTFNKMRLEYKENVSDYKEEQLARIIETFKEVHKNYNGYPVLNELHREFHRRYGFDTTEKDFLEFREVVISGNDI